MAFELTNEQERFLSKLFELCSEYQRVGNVECYSTGFCEEVLQIKICLREPTKPIGISTFCTFTNTLS